jgi:hypothetical protein
MGCFAAEMRMGRAGRDDASRDMEVMDGKLYLGSDMFERGNQVLVEERGQTAVRGTVTMVSQAEVCV